MAYPDFAGRVRARPPALALVLGSGMGSVTAALPVVAEVSFAEVPGLPAASVAGHAGKLALHEDGGRSLLVFHGRVHFYEGHPWSVVERPVRVAAELGARRLLLTNAAGGIGPLQHPGSLMALRDQIEWNRPDAWRLPPAASPYSPRLREHLRAAATGFDLPEGVYASVTGPCYETPAEIRALRSAGADAVGMSTAHEARAAAALGLEVAAVSLITNRAAGLSSGPLSHAEVLETARAQSARLAGLVRAFLARLD